jgi:hypothetical protein
MATAFCSKDVGTDTCRNGKGTNLLSAKKIRPGSYLVGVPLASTQRRHLPGDGLDSGPFANDYLSQSAQTHFSGPIDDYHESLPVKLVRLA